VKGSARGAYDPAVPYRAIADPVQLRRLLEANLLIAGDVALGDILRHIASEACSMTGARYGALGVLDERRETIEQFITVGLTPEEERRIGPRPTGKGVLGVLIIDPQPLRIADLSSHPDAAGFPVGHPPMTSFLGVPIRVRDQVYGNLYLTEKVGWSEFTKDDEALVQALALTAGIAIENAQLHRKAEAAAVSADRDRVARDLHDSVIQRLFAIGLSLQGIIQRADVPATRDRLTEAVADLDDTIRQIRSTIFELGMAPDARGPRAQILELARSLQPVVGTAVPVRFEGPVDTSMSAEVTEHLLACMREALTNVGRHAGASAVDVRVRTDGATCVLEVADNGTGMASDAASERGGGLGLVNMRRRAEKLGGRLDVASSAEGTTVVWSVPL
jgi:signal transduction histidine kinase